MNLRKLQFPRHVHRADGSILVADVAACEAAMLQGYIVIPPGDFVDDEPAPVAAPVVVPPVDVPADVEPPKRKPGRPRKEG